MALRTLADQFGEFILVEPQRDLPVAHRVSGRVGAGPVEVSVEFGKQGRPWPRRTRGGVLPGTSTRPPPGRSPPAPGAASNGARRRREPAVRPPPPAVLPRPVGRRAGTGAFEYLVYSMYTLRNGMLLSRSPPRRTGTELLGLCRLRASAASRPSPHVRRLQWGPPRCASAPTGRQEILKLTKILTRPSPQQHSLAAPARAGAQLRPLGPATPPPATRQY